jgi:hypothetical protein
MVVVLRFSDLPWSSLVITTAARTAGMGWSASVPKNTKWMKIAAALRVLPSQEEIIEIRNIKMHRIVFLLCRS